MESIEYRNQFFFRRYISDTKPNTKKNMKISVSEMRSEWSQKKTRKSNEAIETIKAIIKACAHAHTFSDILWNPKKKHKTAMPFSIPDDGDAASQHMCESSDHRQSKFIAIQHVRKSQSKA